MHLPMRCFFIFSGISLLLTTSIVCSLEHEAVPERFQKHIKHAKILDEQPPLEALNEKTDLKNGASIDIVKQDVDIQIIEKRDVPNPQTKDVEIEPKQSNIKKDLAKEIDAIKANETTSPNESAVNPNTNNVTNPKSNIDTNKTPAIPIVKSTTETPEELHNNTKTQEKINKQSGATKRAIIVFGSLALFVFFYFVYKFYRNRERMNDNTLDFGGGDHQQFKYGILTSNDHEDNLEMSNIPLTAESDDEEELEIFDLEQRKHYMSEPRERDMKNQLLGKSDMDILDIELPGVRSASNNRNTGNNDEDLLNLDDEIDEILRTPANKNNLAGPSKIKNDKYFDVL